MRLPFLSEALIQNCNLLSQKLWVLWLMGCFWAGKGPSGTAHGGVLGPIGSGSLHYAALLPFRGFAVRTFYLKKVWFYALGAVLGVVSFTFFSHWRAPLSPRDPKTTDYGARSLDLTSSCRPSPENGLY